MKLLQPKLFAFSLFFCLFFMSFSSLYAQDANQLLQEGIALHDKGKYNEALKKYEEALKIVPKSPVILYEMALTYFHKRDYKTAIKYSDKVIKSNSTSTEQGYIIKGSALDMLGKTKKSIKLLDGAAKKYPQNHLIRYNLALNYYKIGDLKKAEEELMNSIGLNPEHASSHLILGFVEYDRGRKIPSMMALNFFLLLEPSSQRSEKAFEILQKQLVGNVKKNGNNEFTINIGGAKDDEFTVIEMAMSLVNATKAMYSSKELEDSINEKLEENDSTKTEKIVLFDDLDTEEGKFRFNTKSFFSLLESKDNKENIWWSLYAPIFHALSESEHLETYCYWVSQSSSEKAAKWVEENTEKVTELKKWLARN
ncbi:tetratricopeptide repeat protein [Bernardetia sp.]|uniref:tetratricopeptide repeat protein n=1 Tax=Bernardetia sp. TaxID=1937974 RepID=UPI0025BF5021|nr:tetratricopeptide repeat protein [Bernardetia sp.]